MRRTLDPTNLNRVCNHPEVRPWLRGEGEIDVSPVVCNPANYAFEIDGGGFICIGKGCGIYEVHSQFVPEARRYTLQTMRDSMDYMFTRTDCTALVSHFPDDNPAAHAIGRKGGFRDLGEGVRETRGPFAGCVIKCVFIAEWIAENRELAADGEAFHDALEAAKLASGSTLPVHDDDPIHDRFVGAAIRMVKRGNAAKAVTTYNRWAAENGYAGVTLLSAIPPVIDVLDAIVGLTPDGEIDVLQIR